MQTVSEIVDSKLIFLTSYSHFSLVYTVCITSNGCTKVAWTVYGVCILPYVIVAKDYINHLVFPVWNHDGYDTASVVCYAYFHTSLILKCVEGYFLAVDGCVKGCWIETG